MFIIYEKPHFSSFWICGVAYIFGLQLCAHFDKLKWNIFKELTQLLCCLSLSLAFMCCQVLCCLSCMMWTWKETNKIFCQVKSWNNGECLIFKQWKIKKKPIGCLCVFVLVFSLLHMGQVYIFDLRKKAGHLLCDGVTGWRHPGGDMLLFLSRIYQSAALGKYGRCACSMTQHVSDQIKAGMRWSMLQKGKSEHPEKEQPRSSASDFRAFHLSAIAPVYIDGSCPLSSKLLSPVALITRLLFPQEDSLSSAQ